jgi:hypothetical protein
MVTYFNRKDLVSFGEYLLSKERRDFIESSHVAQVEEGSDHPLPIEDKEKIVFHADVENWLEKLRKGSI